MLKAKTEQKYKIFRESRKRENRLRESSFGKWVGKSEAMMVFSPLVAFFYFETPSIAPCLFLLSCWGLFRAVIFYQHMRKPRQSPLFWKRRHVYERISMFWFSFFMVTCLASAQQCVKIIKSDVFREMLLAPYENQGGKKK